MGMKKLTPRFFASTPPPNKVKPLFSLCICSSEREGTKKDERMIQVCG